MSSQNYKKSISVSGSVNDVIGAVTKGVEFWWTRPDSALVNVGDHAKFMFPPSKSFWTFELTTLTSEHVEWTCVDALHIHEGQPKEIETEWLGTKVHWRITPKGDSTDIELEHVGLIPQLHCYDVCEAGWDMFFLESLQNYLNTGHGSPHKSS